MFIDATANMYKSIKMAMDNTILAIKEQGFNDNQIAVIDKVIERNDDKLLNLIFNSKFTVARMNLIITATDLRFSEEAIEEIANPEFRNDQAATIYQYHYIKTMNGRWCTRVEDDSVAKANGNTNISKSKVVEKDDEYENCNCRSTVIVFE